MIKIDWILEYKGPIIISCSKKSPFLKGNQSKFDGFSLIFQVLGGLGGSKNCKKSIKIGLERFRRAQNDAKTGQERSGQRKMSQHEAPRRLQSGTTLIDGRTSLVLLEPRTPPNCLLYTSPSPRDRQKSRMPSSA